MNGKRRRSGEFARQTIILVISLFFSQKTAIHSASITEGTYQGYKSWVLENEYVKVTVIPEVGGRIVEYIYKPTGNNYFLPYREQKISNNPLLGLSKTKMESNSGGYEDRFWKRRNEPNQSEYLVNIISRKGRQVSLKLTRLLGEDKIGIEKILRLQDRTTELQLAIKIINQSEYPVSYCPHFRVQPGDDFYWDDFVIIPVHNRLNISLEKTETITNPYVLMKKAVEGEFVFQPVQPWWAVIDLHKKLVIGQIFLSAHSTIEGISFINRNRKIWDSQGRLLSEAPALTQEIVFPPLGVGEEQELFFSLVTAVGLDTISWIDNNFALQIVPMFDRKQITFNITPTRDITSGKLFFNLNTTNSKLLLGTMEINQVSPGKIITKTFSLPDQFNPATDTFFLQTTFSSTPRNIQLLPLKVETD